MSILPRTIAAGATVHRIGGREVLYVTVSCTHGMTDREEWEVDASSAHAVILNVIAEHRRNTQEQNPDDPCTCEWTQDPEPKT